MAHRTMNHDVEHSTDKSVSGSIRSLSHFITDPIRKPVPSVLLWVRRVLIRQASQVTGARETDWPGPTQTSDLLIKLKGKGRK